MELTSIIFVDHINQPDLRTDSTQKIYPDAMPRLNPHANINLEPSNDRYTGHDLHSEIIRLLYTKVEVFLIVF